MPPRKRKAEDEDVEESGSGSDTQARILSKIKKDKTLASVVKRGSADLLSDTRRYISTQIATLDYAIGRPGVPAGKLTTIFGREGSSKSTIAQMLLAETQRIGGIGVYIDSEARFEKERAARMGLDPDQLIIIDGATMEQSFEAIKKVVSGIRAEGIDLPVTVVYDSLAGSIPEKRLDAEEVNQSLPALAARIVGTELPRLKLDMAKAEASLVMINQIRSRVNMNADPRAASYRERMKVMGKEQSMLAEWPLIFESALMMFVNSTANIGDDKEKPTGIRARAEIRKSGISPREKWRAEYDVDYLYGPDKVGSKFELLEELGFIVHSSGGWYQLREELEGEFREGKFQRRNFPDLLEELPFLDEIVAKAPEMWRDAV